MHDVKTHAVGGMWQWVWGTRCTQVQQLQHNSSCQQVIAMTHVMTHVMCHVSCVVLSKIKDILGPAASVGLLVSSAAHAGPSKARAAWTAVQPGDLHYTHCLGTS
jgi:hypothetical protein